MRWPEEATPMSDIEKARRLFRDAGLAFPAIPEELAAQLRERDRWLFSAVRSTRGPTISGIT
jgi:hypothetical protein